VSQHLTARFGRARVGLLFVFAALSVGAIFVYRDFRAFAETPLAPLPAATTFEVPLGMPLPGILRELQARGVRPGSSLYWRLLARQMGVAGKLHAGEYALDPGISPHTLLAKMATGEVIQHHFTIVEGWTFAQLREALAHDAGLKQTLVASDDAGIMRTLGAAEMPPEGWFLPETYNYVKGMDDADLLRRAHEAMGRTLEKLWSARAPDPMLQSPYQALILASIVEKETGRADERPLIAGVFLHRLRLGMRLQTDPTVIYGLGAAYDGNLRRVDLDTDTPFNTYTRDGLPPTPIALPGAASLNAVLHPVPTEALYFVARGDGSHEFSATLEAHNHAVAKYQLHHQ